MTYRAPIEEQLFVLNTVAEIEGLGVDPDLTSSIVEAAGKFAEGTFLPLDRVGDVERARWDNGRVILPDGFKAAWDDYVAGGWSSLDAPESAGGQGLPFVLGMAVRESLGSANMAFTLCPILTSGAVEALNAYGSDEQKAVYLPKLVTGEWTGTMNLTEPQAGSDVGALKSTATPAGDGSWRIKGTKIYITFGEHELAPNIVHLVLARTPGAPAGTKGISLFLVPKFRQGPDGAWDVPNDARCVSIEHKLGIHASPTCVMSYGDHDDCHGWLIGEEHGGMRAMFVMMNNARLNVGLQGVQVGERAVQKAIAYAAERVQGGVAIIEHPDVRRMLLRMRALTQGARALVYLASAAVDRGHAGDAAAKVRADLLTPLAKAYATDIGCEVASLGIQVHGGMGYVEETGAAQFLRDARIAPIYEGTNGIQAADLVGRKLTGDGGAGLSALIADARGVDGGPALAALIDAVEAARDRLLAGSPHDRQAGSYPFLDMVSVMTCGWLMAKQLAAAGSLSAGPFRAAKEAVARYYLDAIVPEALGKAAAAMAGAEPLYRIDAATLAA